MGEPFHINSFQKAGIHISLIFFINSLIKPIRDQLIVQYVSFDLHWLFSLSMIITVLLSPAFSLLLLYAKTTQMIRIVHGLHAIILLGVFWMLVGGEVSKELVILFFIVHGFFVLLINSLFWSALIELGDSFSSAKGTARMASFAVIGSISGPLFISISSSILQSHYIVLIAAIINVICILFVKTDSEGSNQVRPSSTIISNKEFTSNLGLGHISYASVATFIYALVTFEIARLDISGREAILIFAIRDLLINTFTLLIQIKFIEVLIRKFGIRKNLLAAPVINSAFLLTMLIVPSIYLIVGGQTVIKTINLSLGRPIREHVFARINTQFRAGIKTLIDTLGYRFGDMIGAWVFYMAIKASSYPFTILTGIILTFIWMHFYNRIGKLYEVKIKKQCTHEESF